MPNTNSKRFGRIKGQVNSALKDALGNVLTSTYITNVTYDDETGTLYFWSGNTLKYSCVIESPSPDSVTAPLYLVGVGYDPEDPQTECGVDITVPSGADVYLYSRDFGQTWQSLSQGTNHFELYGLTPHISLKIQADRTVPFYTSNYLHISTFGKVEAYNNVNSLLSPNFANLTDLTTVVGSGEYCFYYLFSQCSGLLRAPLLPATTLSNRCYVHMFDGCGLTDAPALPATTLATYCYSSMFSGCTSLVNAPSTLPATNLTSSYCYRQMFKGCTSLVNAPEIRATSLRGNDMEYMFQNCTSLTKAPLLPATTLPNYSYREMFNGCTSLNEVKIAATNISASNCLNNWLNNVAATGDFYCVNGMNYPSGVSGKPTNWTRHDLT